MQNEPEPTKHEITHFMDSLFDRAQRLAHENEYLRMVRDAAQDVLRDPDSAPALKRLAYALTLDAFNVRTDAP